MALEKAPMCPRCHTKTMRWSKPAYNLWLCSTASCTAVQVRRDPTVFPSGAVALEELPGASS